jgi:hypothetical protein
MSQVSFFALYSNGGKYQALYDGSTWLRDTTGQKMPVPWRFGEGTFVQFGFDYEPPKGLRVCDWAENARRLNAHLALFIAPQRPATEPISQSEPGTRVHLEERLPGESKLSQLQRSVSANVMQARVARRNAHQNQSTESRCEAERRDAPKVAAARHLASDALHARQRPNYGWSGQPEK